MTEYMIPYLLIFVIAWGTTYFLTPLCMRLAVRFGFLDHPSDRRVHTDVTPRNGGLAVFLGVQVSIFVIWFLGHDTSLLGVALKDWIPFLLASSFLLLVGLYDDKYSISPTSKLIGQISAAMILWFFGVRTEEVVGISLPVVVDIGLTVLWFGFIINAFNLIDGSDGLATGLAIVASVGIAGTLLYRGLYGDLFVVVALVGSCFAFLVYNRHPARIFLGDCGSMFLGLTLAYVTAKSANKGSGMLAIWIPVLAMGVPVADVFLAFWRRVVRSLNFMLFGAHRSGGIFSADMEHIHHRMQRLGFTTKNVTACLCLINAVALVLCFLTMLARDWGLTLFLLFNCALMVVVLRYIVRLELWESGLFVVYTLGARAKPFIAVCIYSLLDLLGLSLLMFVALWLTQPFDSLTVIIQSWSEGFLLWCCVPLVVLFCLDLLRSYSPERIFVYKVNYVVHFALVIMLPVLFLLFLKYDGANRNMIFTVSYCILFVGYYFLIRSMPHYIEHWMRRQRGR